MRLVSEDEIINTGEVPKLRKSPTTIHVFKEPAQQLAAMAAASSSQTAASALLRGQVMVHVAAHNAGAGDPASWAKRRAERGATTAEALDTLARAGPARASFAFARSRGRTRRTLCRHHVAPRPLCEPLERTHSSRRRPSPIPRRTAMVDNLIVTVAPPWEIQASEARSVFGQATGAKRERRAYQQVVGVFALSSSSSSSSSSVLLLALSSSSSSSQATHVQPDPA